MLRQLYLGCQRAGHGGSGVVNCWELLNCNGYGINVGRGCFQNGRFLYLEGVDLHHHPCLHTVIFLQELGTPYLLQPQFLNKNDMTCLKIVACPSVISTNLFLLSL